MVGQLTYDFGAKIQAYVSEKEHCGVEKKKLVKNDFRKVRLINQ